MEKVGLQILQDSFLNKGTAFTEEERDAFNLFGLIPPTVSTLEEQRARSYEAFTNATKEYIKNESEKVKGELSKTTIEDLLTPSPSIKQKYRIQEEKCPSDYCKKAKIE